MSKAQNDKRLAIERKLVAAIRDKMTALANAQFCKSRPDSNSNRDRGNYKHMSRAERQRMRRLKIQWLKNEIHMLLYANGLKPHIRDPQIPRATPEESLAIRFDFDGILHRPDNSLLSISYLSAKQEYMESLSNQDVSPPPKYDYTNYALDTSPVWQWLKNFDNFRQLRKRITRQLAKNHIPPTAVQTMNYYDFVDTITDYCKQTNTRPFEGKRAQNLKMFAHCYHEEFSQVMLSLHYKPRDIQSMLQQMQKGYCPNIFDLHHKTNVTNFRELEEHKQINGFSNMLLAFIHPHHRSLHFDKGYDINKDIVFFGGFDPAYQIRRNPERERQYLISKGRLPKDAKTR